MSIESNVLNVIQTIVFGKFSLLCSYPCMDVSCLSAHTVCWFLGKVRSVLHVSLHQS